MLPISDPVGYWLLPCSKVAFIRLAYPGTKPSCVGHTRVCTRVCTLALVSNLLVLVILWYVPGYALWRTRVPDLRVLVILGYVPGYIPGYIQSTYPGTHRVLPY